MEYYVKAKFPPVTSPTGIMATPTTSKRFADRADAFAFAEQQLDAGATSVVIRPEPD